MGTGTERVCVVDDDPSVRTALARLLRSAGFEVALFASAEEFLGQVQDGERACLILDVRMPGTTGPELHEQLVERGLTLPIVFLTGHGDVTTGVRAMKRGAADFLLKPVDDELLIDTVRAALVRQYALLERTRSRSEVERRLATLTAREREVLELVVRGRLNKQAAGALGIAEKTVKVHRARAMEKMGAASFAELVRLCGEVGLTGAGSET